MLQRLGLKDNGTWNWRGMVTLVIFFCAFGIVVAPLISIPVDPLSTAMGGLMMLLSALLVNWMLWDR